ncbi:MAG: ABC transporter substrate-binding protein [Anaerolineae bacterium]|jgi:peptide/nickel transport system substrate-binding protein
MKAKQLLCVGVVLLFLVSMLAGCGATEAPAPTSPPEPSPAPTEAAAEPTEVPPEPTATEASAEEPVILRVGGMTDVDCWNPFSCTAIYMWGDLILESFVDQGPASEGCPGQPAIVESWERSEDGRTWTLHLHEGITYSDGTPVTAETVKEILEWWSSIEDIAVFNAETLYLESVEVVDDLTLRYTTFEPIINSPDYGWAFLWILPLEWLEIDPGEIFTYDFDPPTGTGPYVLTEYVPGSHMVLDARADYYRGKPPIDRIVYTVYTNADALTSALLAGEIDLTLPFLPPESYEVLAADPNITIEEKFPGDTYNLAFNMSSAGTTHPAIKDPAVREAIDYAIDKDQVVDVVFLGHAVTCPSNWACGPNFEDEVNPDLEITPFDLERANQILEDAGYLDTDGDEVRETAEGQPLEFRLVYISDFPPALTMSEMIADWLAQIGIQVSIEAVDWGTWYDVVTNQRDFDMTIDIALGNIDPVSMDYWHSCWAAEPGGYSTSGFCSEEMDGLVYEFWLSSDEGARWESMFEAQRILHDARPFIIVAGPYQIQAFRNDRFDFPLDTCYDNFGMFTPQGVLNATVR